ncbi:MAG: sugar kinase [Cyclobacteriaceae bacterium]
MIASTGEIILRFSTQQRMRLEQASSLDLNYGGSEMNVLIGLSLMGHKTRFLSRVQEGSLGRGAIRKLNSFQVDSRFIFKGPERMPLYYLEPAAGIRGGNITYDRKNGAYNYLSPDEVDWDGFYDGAHLFHWSGITPGLSKSALELCKTAIDEAAKRQVPVSCDLHFRKNLWDFGISPGDVIPEMLSKTDHLAGNPAGILRMAGKAEKAPTGHMSKDDVFKTFELIRNEFSNLKTVSMLSRQIRSATNQTLQGLLLADKACSAIEIPIEEITDRIGGGDAFMAGLIHGLQKGMEDQETIDFATAVAAYKHTINGDHLEGNIDDFLSVKTKGELDR